MEFRLIQFNGNRDLRCSLDRLTDGLQLSFEVPHARELIWPDYESIRRADNLWLSTCFELFLAGESQSGYTEFNVSPSGAWNCYQFDDYRHGMQPSPCWQLTELEQDDGMVTASFSGELNAGLVRLGPAAILQNTAGKIEHFGLSHGHQPDFHDSSRHVLMSTDDL